MTKTIQVGVGDPNFSAWTVHLDDTGKPARVDIPNAVRSGHTTYKVDSKLSEMIGALQKSDEHLANASDKPWAGRCADALRRTEGSLKGQANHVDPNLDTKTINGSNNIMRQVHEALHGRNLWDSASDLARKAGPVGRIAAGVASLGAAGVAGAAEFEQDGNWRDAAVNKVIEENNPFPETTQALSEGNKEAAKRAIVTEGAELGGGLAGAAAGAALGFATPIPGGTIIGGLVGGIVGAEGMEALAGKVYDYFADEKSTADQVFTAEEVAALERSAADALENAGLVGEVSVGGHMMDMALALNNPPARDALRGHLAETGNQAALEAIDAYAQIQSIKTEYAAANPETVSENEPASLRNNPVMGLTV